MELQLKKIGIAGYLIGVLAALCLGSPFASAEGLPGPAQAKADAALKQLAAWAANPEIIAATREANAKGGMPGMNNGKWNELSENDPTVTALLSTKASMLLKKWETENGHFSKLVLRSREGDVTAASIKPLVYHNTARPVFSNAIKGKPWHADEIKPDPTTQVNGVQISTPVMDGRKVIGVLHASVNVD